MFLHILTHLTIILTEVSFITGIFRVSNCVWLNCLQHCFFFCFSCDADPSALAKYVLALVKKDKSEKELKALCIDQLDVFLQKGKIFDLKILVYFNKSFKAKFSTILKKLSKRIGSNCHKPCHY